MKFSSKEDIEAPISEVFTMLSEFETYERSAIRRGIEVVRLGDPGPNAVGLTWDAKFSLRGKPREVRLVLSEYEPPNAMRIDSDSQGLDGLLTVELVAMSPHRTRMSVGLTLTPKTLTARLLVQSLKLAKSNLTKRFKNRVSEYASNIEDRHSRMV